MSWARNFARNLSITSRFSSAAVPLRVCVVGSGPAGFYTAHQLLKCHADTQVDILERLPVPFGLVRYGVAPDHPEVKNCINQFSALADSGKCRFVGNVAVGKDVAIPQLQTFYHAVVMAYGAEGDRKLGIPGEDLPGVYSARDFVSWYNGLPAHRELNPDLSGEVAVIIGQGNVALDVARILLTPTPLLESTDICDHALVALKESHIRRVHLIGRRGPLQVAFTTKELREMTKLPGCRLYSELAQFDGIGDLLSELPRPRKRLTELMMKTARGRLGQDKELTPGGSSGGQDKELTPGGRLGGQDRECQLTFLRSPVEIVASDHHGRICGVKVEVNKLEGHWDSAKTVGTGEVEEVPCSMLLRSIGYNTQPLEGVPFDNRMGVIPNTAGRVGRGMYCSGWVKTGPVGVILDTMSNAFETAETIIQDYKDGQLPGPALRDGLPPDLVSFLSSLPDVFPTGFSDWKAIDDEERSRGKGHPDKPREKVVSVEEMVKIIKASRRTRTSDKKSI